MLKKLTRKTIPGSEPRPVRVLQFGEGNFLRAFCDWMVDILNEKTSFNGSIQVVQPIKAGMGSLINEQEGLYHLVLNGIQNGKQVRTTRLIRCINGVLNPYDNYEAYLKLAENPVLQFVFSNTTEAGIAYSAGDKSLLTLPESFPGKIAAFLHRRFQHFKGDKSKGLIFLPCELIEKNGATLKEIVLRYATEWNLGNEFKNWVNDHNTFCNTLVDRIVPGFPKDTIKDILDETQFDDKLVVMAEVFHLWVIEGPDHIRQKFPVEKAGLDVKFVKDLTPYRTRKVRILNGAHTALVPVAYLNGQRLVSEAINDPISGKFIREAIEEEIIPTLDLPREELQSFANEVIQRFQNPFIKHELASIALNSVSKYKVRVLPTVLKYIELKKAPPKRLLYSLAALIRFYKGTWKGEALPVNDTPEVMAFFGEAWLLQDFNAIAARVLGSKMLWGDDHISLQRVSDLVAASLREIEELAG
jgi:tagaturonate reductase